QDREPCELEGDRKPRHDRVADREPALVGAEVAANDVAEPAHVLHRHWPVETVVMSDLSEHGRVAILAAERERRVARQSPHAEKHEHAREQEDDQGGPDLTQEEAAHARLLPPIAPYVPNPAYCARISPSPKI